MLVQISRRAGVIKRVPEREEPVIELHLEPSQYVTDVKLTELVPRRRDERVTKDYAWSCFVVTPLGPETA